MYYILRPIYKGHNQFYIIWEVLFEVAAASPQDAIKIAKKRGILAPVVELK